MSDPFDTAPRPSVGDLLGQVTKDLSALLRQEVDLAKAELKDTATQAARGGALYAGATVGAHCALLFASIALWWAAGEAMGHGWSALVVAGLWAAVAAVLAVHARAQTRRVEGLPRTADTVKKIPHAMRGHEEKHS
ncbi:phage holin family protein [Cellulomonas soli]